MVSPVRFPCRPTRHAPAWNSHHSRAMPTCLTELDYPLTDPDIQLRYPHFEHGHAGVDIPLAVLVDLILRKLYPGRAVSIYQAGALPGQAGLPSPG